MTAIELREARLKLGLSQQKMADLIHTSRRTWQDWEYGINPVPGPTACLMFLLVNSRSALKTLRNQT
jgi:DNA-binding transcriptional regulator YiaG